ncbi:MAG: restriction endonuclease, partial [Janthinobacterium lividum]
MSKTKRLFYKAYQVHDHVDTEHDGDDLIGINVRKSFDTANCPNCNNPFKKYENKRLDSIKIKEKLYDSINLLFFCYKCGWWQLRQEFDFENNSKINWAYQYHSILDTIDIASNEVEIDNLKKHLLSNWSDRRFIAASKAEELVRDILKEHLSCDVFYTTSKVNTPDGGIDLYICYDNTSIKTAVQVKRRVNREIESIHEVRNFVGAMVIAGFQKGIFVTTAERFTRNTYQVPQKLKLTQTRLELDLIDGDALLKIMKATTPSLDPSLPLGLTPETIWQDINNELLTYRQIFETLQ